VRLLLDTHILLWWLGDDSSLPGRARDLIAETDNEVFVSPMSLWEIAIKSRLGRLRGDPGLVLQAATASGFRPLSFTLEHAAEVARLPDHHRDPFDRGLIAQARWEPLLLVTHDRGLTVYGESILCV
jgi:PIN domain nuclease of toxin-antitoxin system